MGRTGKPVGTVAACALAAATLATSAIGAERGPSRYALLVEGGATWESHAPQSFLLVDPSGREPQLEFGGGSTHGLALDVQIAPVLVLRAGYEAGDTDLSITLFPPEGLDAAAPVAATDYEALRVGIFLHGLLRRDLFAPDAESRVMGRFGVSVARARFGTVVLEEEARDAFSVESVSLADSWIFAVEAEWIARFGRSRWFGGVGAVLGIGPGPEVVLEPASGSPFVRSEFEYRSNRLVARLGYRF